jgi:hypothetical protein
MEKQIYKNCQSCGMPLSKDPNYGGSEKDGLISTKYCSYCYSDGEFVGGNDVTLKEFSEMSRKGMVVSGKSKFIAWLFSRSFMMAHLERWKDKA